MSEHCLNIFMKSKYAFPVNTSSDDKEKFFLKLQDIIQFDAIHKF